MSTTDLDLPPTYNECVNENVVHSEEGHQVSEAGNQ